MQPMIAKAAATLQNLRHRERAQWQGWRRLLNNFNHPLEH